MIPDRIGPSLDPAGFARGPAAPPPAEMLAHGGWSRTSARKLGGETNNAVLGVNSGECASVDGRENVLPLANSLRLGGLTLPGSAEPCPPGCRAAGRGFVLRLLPACGSK